MKKERVDIPHRYSKENLESILRFLAKEKVVPESGIDWNRFSKIFLSEERDSYKYIEVFKITSPRRFGESWVQTFLIDNHPQFRNPSKSLDPDYSNGQYDLWYKGLRIEVKASRAISSAEEGSVLERALRTQDKDPFVMNFQQIKPGCCDVFLLVAFWLDSYRIFCIPSDSMMKIPKISNQHRNGQEKQLLLNDRTFCLLEPYEVKDSDIEKYLDELLQKDV